MHKSDSFLFTDNTHNGIMDGKQLRPTYPLLAEAFVQYFLNLIFISLFR